MTANFLLDRIVRKGLTLMKKVQHDKSKSDSVPIEVYKNRCLSYIERINELKYLNPDDIDDAAPPPGHCNNSSNHNHGIAHYIYNSTICACSVCSACWCCGDLWIYEGLSRQGGGACARTCALYRQAVL